MCRFGVRVRVSGGVVMRRVTRLPRPWRSELTCEVVRRTERLDAEIVRSAAQARRTPLGARLGRATNEDTAVRLAVVIEHRRRASERIAAVVQILTDDVTAGRCPYTAAAVAGVALLEVAEGRAA